MAIKENTISQNPSSYDTTHYSCASISSSYPITNAYTASDSTSYCQVKLKTGSQVETYIYLKFDFSEIPEGATIKTITAKAKGYISSTNTSRITSRQMQLATGTTLKGSALNMSTSQTEQTFSNVGTWTWEELQDAGIRFYAKRGTSSTSSNYYIRMYGATMSVTYEWDDVTYAVTINNYSTATATADPIEVNSGASSDIKINDISGLTITDNNIDITSQFTQQQEEAESYTVENIGNYGFSLNTNNYYQSNNKGINKSAAVCRVHFYVPVAATITFTFINYAEQGYDFGVFGNIDTALNTNYYPAGSSGATISDTNYKLACNSSTYNSSSTKTLTYQMTAGEHYIDVKFSKDDESAANNDTLQFKVAITLNESFVPGTFYQYTITNIQTNHIIVITSDGHQSKIYIKENNVWKSYSKVYKKINGTWVIQNDWASVFDTNANYKKEN